VLVGRFLDEPEHDGTEQYGGGDFHDHRSLGPDESPGAVGILASATPRIVDGAIVSRGSATGGPNPVNECRLPWVVALLALAGVAAAAPPAGTLRFDAEEILIDVRGDVVEVTGIYHFRVVDGPVPAQPMLYPYPVDPLLGAARTLRLERRQDDGRWTALAFEELPPQGVRWHLPAAGSGTLAVRTVYRQAMRGTYARYIVTTTGAWGQPLRKASFELRLPADARDPTFSHPFRPKGPSVRVWTYEATDFQPRKDIVVRYRR
jgi:hypothetical protein